MFYLRKKKYSLSFSICIFVCHVPVLFAWMSWLWLLSNRIHSEFSIGSSFIMDVNIGRFCVHIDIIYLCVQMCGWIWFVVKVNGIVWEKNWNSGNQFDGFLSLKIRTFKQLHLMLVNVYVYMLNDDVNVNVFVLAFIL